MELFSKKCLSAWTPSSEFSHSGGGSSVMEATWWRLCGGGCVVEATWWKLRGRLTEGPTKWDPAFRILDAFSSCTGLRSSHDFTTPRGCPPAVANRK
eukprot:4136712-Pyramimonas_sp.AAC.1